jgi:hypothetical protein
MTYYTRRREEECPIETCNPTTRRSKKEKVGNWGRLRAFTTWLETFTTFYSSSSHDAEENFQKPIKTPGSTGTTREADEVLGTPDLGGRALP